MHSQSVKLMEHGLDLHLTRVYCNVTNKICIFINVSFIVDCGPLSLPLEGRVTLAGAMPNSRGIYTCDQVYSPVGSTTLVCLADGNWSGVTECLGRFFIYINFMMDCMYILISVNCRNPPNLTNGRITSQSGTVGGSVATYSCDSGYKLVGNSGIVCQDDTTWSTLPQCQGMCDNYYE